MPEWVQAVLDFVRHNQQWAAPIVFALAFAESLAFVSLIAPATVLLWGIGGLVGLAGLSFWPIWFAAAIGAALGDWLSYWLGFHFHDRIVKLWPLSRHPDLVKRTHELFEKWGVAGVFIGRFFGPLRAIVPLIAGAVRMPRLQFQLANWSSAVVWATLTLTPGMVGMEWLGKYFGK
ncbi:DedA family protein [Methylocella sp. CPCC 101449]|jgi:membrane protein DedA with SNARE-associated domain|uniref:DedA family protein n=1 Tax=Methylocella sp. CPCC 101449 TaxID=2987531 RepID=UPI0028919147|nr:DedA family protein [Methylocella sp. CPCC 101449]MDT2019258.1 DedA family protein [Methylocella sp. CPCC 101449]HEV2573343.1 DedA family protein [Beijerinckiaceae bacterium]